LSRKESIKLQYELDSIRQQNSQLYLKIGLASSEINQQNLTIPALNEAYFLFLQNTPSKYAWIVEDKDSIVPVKAFGVTSNKQIYFNSADFYLKPEKASYSEYDFHDFIHYIVGSANTQFASKYYPSYDNNGQVVEAGLINLPKNLRSLITSSPKKENLKSDGYILSNKTFSWFYEKFEDLGSPIHILPEQQKQIVEYISEKLKEYLQELNVSLLELAVLMQNKLYEASASECESLGFVRGGAGDPLKGKTERGRADLDILFNLNPLQKIAEVAKIARNPDFRFHHEHRNTLRNRAQVLGYRKFAKQIEQKIFEKLEPSCDAKFLALKYKSSYLEIARSEVELFEETQEFLEKLKIEGKELAIISTKSSKAIEQHLKDFGISSLFSLVIGGDSVTNQKPDPEGIFLAIKSLQANPKTTIMIGDTKDDLLAAKNAEIKSALVEWTNQPIESLKSEFKPILIGSWKDFRVNLESEKEFKSFR
jgi:HAD superfamily hydrolase (TIGR01549 family)